MDLCALSHDAGLAVVPIALLYGGGFTWSLRVKRVTFVDTLWGLSFSLIALLLFPTSAGARHLLLLAAVVAWGLRLSVHLYLRNKDKGEDDRYLAMRRASSLPFAAFALRRVFAPQAIVAYVVASPIVVGMTTTDPPGPLFWVGAAVWTLGFLFESIGDAQLSRFRRDPANKGRVLDTGLWAWSRHPNYFGDAAVWTGLWLMCAGQWQGWLTVVSPIVMTYYLYARTGKEFVEDAMARTRGPEYLDYLRRTSGFFPLPRRSPKP